MSPARVMIIRSTDTFGGAERQIIGFARRFDPEVIQPVVCGFADDSPAEGNPLLSAAAEDGIETAVIPTTKGFDLRGMGGFAEMAGHLGIDLLCPQDYRSNVYALAARRRQGIPIVATAHGYTGHTLSVKVYESIDRMATLRLVDWVVCVSDALRRRIVKWGVPARKLYLVHNSIEVPHGRGSQAEAGGEEQGSNPTVCSVGRLSTEKGHRFLLAAWPQVIRRHPSARLVLVGDGPERETLIRQAVDLGVSSSVEFAGFTDTPMDYLRACDVFVLPSLAEGLPVALLEACSLGKPVAASDVGGVGELVAAERSGILVPPSRPERLAEAIIRLLDDPGKARAMGRAALAAARAGFSFEKNVPLLQRIYLTSLIGGKQRELREWQNDLCKE